MLTSTAAAVGLGGGTVLLQHKFSQAKSVRVSLDDALPGSMNILLLGSDSRAFVDDPADKSSFGDTRAVGGQRADVIIIARVEPKTRRGVLVSIPRDTLVRLPKYKGLQLINQSFEDGPQGVIDAIKSNFGVPINHYAEIDFAGFRAMVDAIGGVRMYVPAPSRDRPNDPKNGGTGLDIKTAGCQTFNGTQALAWVRSRYFQYYEAGKWRSDPTADIGRITRQQDFIRRLMAQAVQKGALNPLRASHLADAAMANLTVDSTFNVKDALRLVQAFRPVGAAGIEMVALPTGPSAPPGRQRRRRSRSWPGSGVRCSPPPAGGQRRAKAPKVAPGDVKVRVLNGSGAPRVAGDSSADLAAAGFSPAGSGDADNFGYAKTEIHYAAGAQAKAALLARYLGGVGKLVADSTIRGTDLVLVVGGDWKGVIRTGVRPGTGGRPGVDHHRRPDDHHRQGRPPPPPPLRRRPAPPSRPAEPGDAATSPFASWSSAPAGRSARRWPPTCPTTRCCPSTGPGATWPTATRWSRRSPPPPRRGRQLRRLDRRRRLRGRPRAGRAGQRPRSAASGRRLRAGRRPPRARLHRLRLLWRQGRALRRVGRAPPRVGLRPLQARGRTGGGPPRRLLGHRPHLLGVRPAGPQLRRHHRRAGPGGRRRCGSSTTSGCPTYAPDLAGALARLAVERRPGVYHVTNQGACTWHDLASAAVELAGLDPSVVGTTSTVELKRPAPRPANSVLSGAAWAAAGLTPLRPWREALADKLGGPASDRGHRKRRTRSLTCASG